MGWTARLSERAPFGRREGGNVGDGCLQGGRGSGNLLGLPVPEWGYRLEQLPLYRKLKKL